MNLVAQAPTGQVGHKGKPIDYRVLDALEEPLTETNGDTFYVDQDRQCDGSGASVNDDDLSVNSWIVVRDDDEAASGTPGAATNMESEEAPGAPEPDGRECAADAEVQEDSN